MFIFFACLSAVQSTLAGAAQRKRTKRLRRVAYGARGKKGHFFKGIFLFFYKKIENHSQNPKFPPPDNYRDEFFYGFYSLYC